MKLKIDKPDWIKLTYNLGYGCPIKPRSLRYLDKWFEAHVEPINKMLAEGVEVKAKSLTESGLTEEHGSGWIACELTTRMWPESTTHKALLINIQPIKKETAEDVLREIIEDYDYNEPRGDTISKALLDKAYAVLKDSE